ncbi:arginyltransferase, variant 2 [Balamuthia mandrillaris]
MMSDSQENEEHQENTPFHELVENTEEKEEEAAEELGEHEAFILARTISVVFPQLSIETIQDVLQMTNGNIEETTNILLTLSSASPSYAEESQGREDLNAFASPFYYYTQQSLSSPSLPPPTFDHLPDSPSIIVPYGASMGRCGYCHSQARTSASWGMTATKLRVEDYEALMDRGWSRSGTWAYRPTNSTTCCVQYQIRLDVTQFRPSKTQRAVFRKMDKFLAGEMELEPEEKREEGTDNRKMEQEGGQEDKNEEQDSNKTTKNDKEEENKMATETEEKETQERERVRRWVDEAVQTVIKSKDLSMHDSSSVVASNLSYDVKGNKSLKEIRTRGHYSTNVAIRLWATLLREQKCTSSPSSSAPSAMTTNTTSTPDDIAACLVEHMQHQQNVGDEQPQWEKLGVRRGFINIWMKEPSEPKQNEERQKKALQRSNQDKKEKQIDDSTDNTTTPIPKHHLQISTHPPDFMFEAFDLYKRYQMLVHKEEPSAITPEAYRSFLCDSPLFADEFSPPWRETKHDEEEEEELPPECKYGTVHQHYRIDGKLVAVGVLDVLPHSLVSVYFFHDPSYASLSLGVFSALKEIELTQKLCASFPQFKYYYMGTYLLSLVPWFLSLGSSFLF